MGRRKSTIIVLGVLIIGFFGFCFTQSVAQTADEQKQFLIGEWSGVWAGGTNIPLTLIIHEIDTAKAKARCTYISSYTGLDEKFEVLADFTPGPNPRLEFKAEGNELKFILENKVLQGRFKGIFTNTTTLEKKPKK